MKAKQERIQQLLSETILALCNNGLEFDCELEVDGLLGITLDKKDVFLVKISEVLTGRKTSLHSNTGHYRDDSAAISSPRSSAEDSLDSSSVTVPAKRLPCTQLRPNRSPKRKKQEEEDDELSPQDLSQRTHSPCIKQEVPRPDSNSRESPAAAIVRMSPVQGGAAGCSQWKGSLTEDTNMEDNLTAPQPVCTKQIILINIGGNKLETHLIS